VVTDDTKKAMREILDEVQSGQFAREWMDEWESGAENFNRLRKQSADSQVEKVGAELRSMMPWIINPGR
jgi:ketol-acid reductoisomerase